MPQISLLSFYCVNSREGGAHNYTRGPEALKYMAKYSETQAGQPYFSRAVASLKSPQSMQGLGL